MKPVVSFVGHSHTGKTTFVVKVIREMKRRGYRVGIVKHDVHRFEMDYPGKDTWRHAQAGAEIVCLSSPGKLAAIRQVDNEIPLDKIVQNMQDMDIIFTEGFKQENKPQIEVYRRQSEQEPLGRRKNLLAIVSDIPLYENVLRFGFDDELPLCDFLIQHFQIQSGRR